MTMAEQQNRPGPEISPSSDEEDEWSQKNKWLPPPLNRRMSQKKAPRRPGEEEMSQYNSREGLDKQAATEKVTDDSQKALTNAVSRFPSRTSSRNAEEAYKTVSGTLESLSNRLSAVEAKVHEKPNLGGVFTAGVAAGGFLHAVPHVFKAISQIGRSVKDVISSSRV